MREKIQAKVSKMLASRAEIIGQLQELNNKANQLQVQLHALNGGLTELQELLKETEGEKTDG